MKGIWKSRIEVYRNVFLDEDEFRYSWVEYAAGSQFTRKGIEFTREYDDWVNLEVTSGTASMVKDVTFSSDDYNRIATRVKRNSGSWGIWLWDSGAGSWYKPFDTMTESGFFEASLPAGKTYTRVLVLVQGTPGTFDSDFDYVTIYKEDVIISKAERIYYKDEINEAIPVSTIELGLPKETEPKVGDLIKLYLAKETGSMVKVQVGKISFKKEVEKEKLKDIEITVMSKARAALDKVVTHDSKRDDWKVLLDDVTAPLVDKTLVYFEARGDSQTVTMQKAKNRKIFSQLKSLAKLAELDMTTTPTGETIYVYKESFFNSAIESLSPYPDAIYDLEYDVDDKRIKNMVSLEANNVMEKDNTSDGYSDSLTGWYGYKDTGTWEVNNPTLSNYSVAGGYSIHIRGTECYGLWLVRDLEKQLDLERGYLSFQNSGNDARQTLVPYFLRGGTWTETHVYLMEDVASSPPTDNYARRRIPFPGKTDVAVVPPRPEFSKNKMPLGQKEDAWEVSNFDWNKVKGLGFLVRPKSGWWDNELAILDYFVDELNLSQLRIATSYVVQSSVDLYGERELGTKNYYPELKTLEEMEEKAKSLIDPIAYPEESVRSLKCRRVLDTYPGRAIYLDIPGKEGDYYLQSVEYTLEDVYLETTVTLSKSIVEEPVRTKEVAFIDTRRRIKELEEKVAVLETDIAAYTEARELLGATPTSQSGGNLEFNVGFDWASIATGINELAIDVVTQMFNSWSKLGNLAGNILWSWVETTAWTASQIAQWLTSWTQMVNASALGLIDLVSHVASVTWSTFFNWITSGLTAITSAGVIASNAIDSMTQVVTGLFTDLTRFGANFPLLNFFNFRSSPWSGEFAGKVDSGFYLYPTTMVSMEKNLFEIAPTATDQVAYIREYSTTTPYADKTWVKGRIRVNNFGTNTVAAFGIQNGAPTQVSFKKAVFYFTYYSASLVRIRGKCGDGTADKYTMLDAKKSWNTWYDFEMRWDGTTVRFIIDGVEFGQVSQNLPSGDGTMAIWIDSYNSSNPTLEAQNPKRSET